MVLFLESKYWAVLKSREYRQAPASETTSDENCASVELFVFHEDLPRTGRARSVKNTSRP